MNLGRACQIVYPGIEGIECNLETNTFIKWPTGVINAPDPQTVINQAIAIENDYRYLEQRTAAYPKEHELLMALWEKVVEGDSTNADLLQAQRVAVKAAYPKPPTSTKTWWDYIKSIFGQ